jgi:circadian clock protein KaiC
MGELPVDSAAATDPPIAPTVSTGIAGLDEVLRGGGLPAGHTYLVTGNAGSGKTTLGLHFLMAGRARGERGLYLTLSETVKEIEGIARSHGWSLEGIDLREIIADQRGEDETEQTVFKASEVELTEFRTRLEAAVEQINPDRVVIDSLSELRLLAGDSRQHRKQVALLKRYFGERGCTVLITDDNTSEEPAALLHSLVHGVFALTRTTRAFGGARRKLEVLKVRALAFSDGLHDYAIRTGGMVVYPRLVAAAHRTSMPAELVLSGLPSLDALLGGGIHRGTSVALIGPSGIGKSMTALQYVLHNVSLGSKASIFLFDESLRTMQLNAVGAKLATQISAGQTSVDQIDPAEVSPGEFTARVRRAVETGAQIIVIDGLNGYLNAMPDEQLLRLHLHELLAYLSASNVTSILLVNQPGDLVPQVDGDLDVSYLADTVILYRNYEHRGEVHGALSVLKHRGASVERTLRELTMSGEGIEIGKPLRNFRGVLTGTPWLNDRHERPKR